MVQNELAGRSESGIDLVLLPLETNVQGLDVGDDGRIRRPAVLEVQRPFDGREIVVFRRHPAERQFGFWVGPSPGSHRPLVVELLDLAIQPPCREQCGRGLAVVAEREGQIRGDRRRLLSLNDRQIPQPQDTTVRQRDLRIRPVRLIAGDAVAGVTNFQQKFRRTPEVDIDSLGRHPLMHDL